MVSPSLTEEVQLTESLAKTIENFRIKHGSKPCNRKDVRGVFTLTLYGENHAHLSKFGDISITEILLATMELLSQASSDGMAIPIE